MAASAGGLSVEVSTEALLATGIPILIIPENWSADRIARNVMVGWNASPPSRRAVSDAIPLLKAATSVALVVVDGQKNDRHGEEPGADLARHLVRHGIEITVDQIASQGSIEDTLIAHALSRNIDLIVIGAYSHSRTGEMIFGGVTRSLTRMVSFPTFIAH